MKLNSIIIISIVVLSVTLLRILYSYVTGFIFPDEALYYVSTFYFFKTGHFVYYYGDRQLFQLFVLAFSIPLRIDTIQKFLIVGPILATLFSISGLIVFDRILKRFHLERRYTVLMFGLSPVFVILSVFVLTESIALFFVMLGIYFALSRNSLPKVILSSVAFTIASFMREPYAIFLLGNFIYMLFKTENRRALVASFFGLAGAIVPVLSILSSIPLATAYYYYRQIIRISGIPISEVVQYPLFHVVGFWTQIWNFIIDAPLGLLLGFGISTILVAYSFVKYRVDGFLRIQVVCSVLSYIAIVVGQARFAYYGSLAALSGIVRYSHIALPMLLTLGVFYSYYKGSKQKIVGIMCLFLVVTSVSGLFISAGISLNNASLGYRAPWLKADQYMQNIHSHSLIMGEPTIRLSLFVTQSDVDIAIPPATYNRFVNITKSYDHIFLYDEKHINHIPAIENNFPWYLQLEQNQTQYKVHTIWNDSESDFYEVIL